MKLPSAEEYLQIIDKKAPGTLATLYNHKFILDANGLGYLYKSSRNTIIFKTEYDSKFYAVRFFLQDDDELFRRYHQVEAFLNSKNLSWKVPFRFMDEEYYPVVSMDWVDGLSFTDYLDLIMNNPSLISQLQEQLISLSRDLEKNGIGHGNLNMKHIRFVKDGQNYVLKLIDYDSMFIAPFKEKDSFSVGTAGFQHSMRLASDFSETIDRFSIWIFITALEAFKIDPLLWTNSRENGFDKNQQILFTYRDIAFSQQSAAFQKLRRYNNPALNFYCDKLIDFCNAASLDQIEAPKLYNEKNVPSIEAFQPKANPPEEAKKEVFVAQPQTVADKFIEKKIIPAEKKANPIEQKTVISVKPVLVQEKQTEKKSKESQQQIQNEHAYEPTFPVKRKRKKPVAALIIIAILILSAVGYLAWNKQAKKENKVVAAVPETTSQLQDTTQKKEEQKTKETVFTSASITQFLFQLYQAYNKRELPSIMSNYAENVNQYYDAGSVQKSKLVGVIKNLFIKPEYYECHPDLTTLKINELGDSCKLTISIKETIKADKRSRRENYSSTIEYTIDTAFKIIAEKTLSD